LSGGERRLRPDDPLTVLKGIGPRSAEVLAGEGLTTIQDLLFHLPLRWEDRTRVARLDRPISVGESVLVRGRVSGARVRRIPRRRLQIVDGVVEDGRGRLPVVWFNQPWIHNRLDGEQELYLFGTVRRRRGGGVELVNPEVDLADEDVEGIVPVYPRLGRFGTRAVRRLMEQCLSALPDCSDPLPAAVRDETGLPALGECLLELHRPKLEGSEDRRRAMLEELESRRSGPHTRLAFDELLAFACAVEHSRRRRGSFRAPQIGPNGGAEARLRALLPFRLTAAQDRVVGEIVADLGRRRPMARLLQGDVGSGKTVVAALAMTAVLDAGLQVAMMAPTELLAEQHLRSLEMLGRAGYPPELLVGSMAGTERRRVLQGLADGSVRVVVGTHALFQENVAYRRLGLVVVDEQHRFGVTQRSALVAKGRSPHLLVMTATPIPRSLTMTVYGDLDLSLVDELPPGRQPVQTELRPHSARPRVLSFVRRELEAGGRAFFVCPHIEINEDLALASIEDREESLREAFSGFGVGVVHGRLSREEREAVTSGFRTGEIQVLLATTVVEVGVDVPDATVMVIESAQHFGLSQLHQLRGRVGRGERRSWCILLADREPSANALRRLEAVCRTGDGFEIAEADLRLRGPGELTGTRQWGPAAFRFADLARDIGMIAATRDRCAEMTTRELQSLRKRLARYYPVDAGLLVG
jgi:ATP-dependent DNA helicase RecG